MIAACTAEIREKSDQQADVFAGGKKNKRNRFLAFLKTL